MLSKERDICSNFFIRKEGYECNPEQTYDRTSTPNYWTGKRLRLNLYYQYHVYELAAEIASEYNARRILDVGCGPAMKMRKFFANLPADYTLVDQPNAKQLVESHFPSAKFLSVDLSEPPELLEGAPFDLIICADVIEHLSYPDRLLALIYRNLDKEGRLVLSTPNRDIRRGKDNVKPDNPAHVREWNMQEFSDFLSWGQFQINLQESAPLGRLSYWRQLLRDHLGWYSTHPVYSGSQIVVCTK